MRTFAFVVFHKKQKLFIAFTNKYYTFVGNLFASINMKNIYLLVVMLFCSIASTIAQNVDGRICTEQEIPMNVRANYRKQAEQSIAGFYATLPFCIENRMIQSEIIKTYMVENKASYLPDFKTGYKNPLVPEQYLQEFFKHYSNYKPTDLTIEIVDVTFEKDFHATSMVSCYIIANYKIIVREGETKLFSNDCLFPNASNWLNTKIVQIEPQSDITNDEQRKQEKKVEDYKKSADFSEIDKSSPFFPSFNQKCSGIVYDEKGNTLMGAMVTSSNPFFSTTDSDGTFSLTNVQVGDSIEVNYIGYLPDKDVWNGFVMYFKMKPDTDNSIPESILKKGGIKKERVSWIKGGSLKNYAICYNAFHSLKNAQAVFDFIKSKGFLNACIVMNENNKAYRVIVDSFNTEKEAVSFLKKFKKGCKHINGNEKSWVLHCI